MGQHSERVREGLLDAAEELFARYGIDAVSNRRIAEHAGTANHSAIAYHFGGRDELLRALLSRQLEEMNTRRVALVAQLGEDADVRALLACLLLPWVEHLASLPVPSWRARFMFQVCTVPSGAEVLRALNRANPVLEDLVRRLEDALSDLPPRVVRGRFEILGQMPLGLCAEHEARVHDGTQQPSWTSVGYFLIDACAGRSEERRVGKECPV